MYNERGFTCEGNDFDNFMLLTGKYMLNHVAEKRTIYPYIHNHNNRKSLKDIYRPITIPDVDVHAMTQNSQGDFRMAAGDFLEIYSKRPGSFHVVITCFFLDTSHFVLDYIDVIWNCLKEGGYWLNLGPLTYHYSDAPGQVSIELTWEEIINAAQSKGFVVEKQEFVNAHYCQDPHLMKKNLFECGFFSLVKGKSSTSVAK